MVGLFMKTLWKNISFNASSFKIRSFFEGGKLCLLYFKNQMGVQLQVSLSLFLLIPAYKGGLSKRMHCFTPE